MKTFTAQERKQIKRTCKAQVTQHLGRCIGVYVLYLVPFLLLMALMYAAMFGKVIALMLAGYTDEYMLTMAMMQGMNLFWVALLVMLLVSGPLHLGLMRFYLGLQRGEEPGVSTLFHPFTSLRSVWAGIRMQFCLAFRSFLWMIGPILVYIVLAMAIAVNAGMLGGPPFRVAGTVLYILFYAVLLLINIKLMAYQAGWVALCDDETQSVWDATRQAAAVFRGQFGKLLVFVLSFLGWILLTVGVLWLCIGLGYAGLFLIGGGLGVAVLVAASVAMLCLVLVMDAFVTTYQMTSFFGMYAHLSAPEDTVPPMQDTQPPQW